MNDFKKINKNILLAIIILIILSWLICFIIRFTNLIQEYVINLITSIVMKNSMNLLFVLIPTIVMYKITCRLEKDEEKKK